ncbi:MAG: hypothetical protein F6K42_04770 [Leptolyngbya sp. SIO1D8]|nr:hypothetical protein [Leptolyngbya sp. SIO1D8]
MLTEQKLPHSRQFLFLILIVLCLGIAFRFYNLDHKVFWNDETLTALRASGYSAAEVVRDSFTGDVIDIQDFRRYLRIGDRTAIDTVKALASENSQHPPLYYVLVHYWMQWFGSSVTAIRSLSVALSLLVFPCFYWFCQELFKAPAVGLFGIMLIAVSPIHVLYSQEARPYMLWIVLVLLSNTLLIKATRHQNDYKLWIAYAITLATACYTFLFSIFVAIAHGIYVFVLEKFRLSKLFQTYLLSSLLAILLYTPWIWIVINSLSKINETTAWAQGNWVSLSRFAIARLLTFNVAFFDINTQSRFDIGASSVISWYWLIPIIPLTIFLTIYSLYFLSHKTSLPVWSFVLILILTPVIALAVPDLLSGGGRSAVPRYLFPSFLAIQASLAYLFSRKQVEQSGKFLGQPFWNLAFATLISMGIFSCMYSAQSQDWWIKANRQGYALEAAEIINQSQQPLLITDDDAGDVLSLSYLLTSNVKLKLLDGKSINDIPDGFDSIFLYKPSEELRLSLEESQAFDLEVLQKPNRFWQGFWLVKENT